MLRRVVPWKQRTQNFGETLFRRLIKERNIKIYFRSRTYHRITAQVTVESMKITAYKCILYYTPPNDGKYFYSSYLQLILDVTSSTSINSRRLKRIHSIDKRPCQRSQGCNVPSRYLFKLRIALYDWVNVFRTEVGKYLTNAEDTLLAGLRAIDTNCSH
jgi:hypothetical protein